MSRVIHFILAAALVSGAFAAGQDRPSQDGAQQQTARVPAIAVIRSVGMTVSDMDRAVRFYSGALAFEKVSDVEVTGREYEQLFGVFGLRIRVVAMQLGDELLTLTQYIAPSDGKPIPIDSRSNDLWFEHMAIVVSDMDRAFAHVQKHGIRFISTAPQTLPKSNAAVAGIKAFKFKDPDGHALELLWFPADKGVSKWHEPTDKVFMGISHTAISVSDTEKSLQFYRDLLGMQITGKSLNVGTEQEHLDNVFGARVRVTSVRPPLQPPHVEFLDYVVPSDGRPMPRDVKAKDIVHWQTEMVVDEIDPVVKRLREHGVRLVSPRVCLFPDKQLGFKKAAMALDPDGHAMLLIEKVEP